MIEDTVRRSVPARTSIVAVVCRVLCRLVVESPAFFAGRADALVAALGDRRKPNSSVKTGRVASE
jgi:hypothetical protein